MKWRIEGPFDSSYSLALLNRETALALESLGVEVALHSTEGGGDFEPNQNFLQQNPNIAKLYKRSSQIPQAKSDVTSRNLYPPRVCDMQAPISMLHHYAWEESGFPQEWVENFNQCLDGLTTLSTHVQKILIDNGVKVPMSVSGCGVDHWERISPKEYKLPKDVKRFRFLHVSSCFPRKGVDVLLKAYGDAFSSDDDVTLIIKTFPNPHNEVHHWLKEAKRDNTNYPDVVIIEDDLSSPELKSLYEQCNALVAPSRAEGFGLPIAEAMLSNLAVITTAWGGQLDFCDNESAWLVDFEFAYAKTHFNLFDSVWAEPSRDDLSKKLRQVYTASKYEIGKKTAIGQERLLKYFTWKSVAKRLIKTAQSITQSKESHSAFIKLGWVTTWNTPCGIASYSYHLLSAFEDVTILAPYSTSLVKEDEPNVYRCFQMGDDPLYELDRVIEQKQLQTIVIQFNYDFFNFYHLYDFIIRHYERGRQIVITMHSTSDPKNILHKRLSKLVPALKLCERILVHSVSDLNCLKSYGLVNNVTLFPHGIPQLSKNQSFKIQNLKSKITLASYGFFLPHKGLLELIEALSILNKRGLHLKLKMVNAKYPVKESQELIEKAKKKIASLNLQNRVELITDYLPEDESLQKLSNADIIILPYQFTGESSSAAVRYALATAKPIAVTPLSIFDDVANAVFKLPGITPLQLANGIEETINHLRKATPKAQAIASCAKKYRETHLYPNISKRLKNMLILLRYKM